MGLFRLDEINRQHCQSAIKTELTRGNDSVQVHVDIEKKTVKVENLGDDRVLFLLKEMGYYPEKIEEASPSRRKACNSLSFSPEQS